MSLLHKALKKAERSGEDLGREGVFLDAEEGGRPSKSPWKILLLSILIACLLLAGAVGLLQFKKTNSVSDGPKPKTFNTPLEIAGGPGAAELGEKARSLIQSGRFEEARVSLEKVVILQPRNEEAYNNLGYVLKKLGKKEEAFEQYQKALSINPRCAECRNNLGAIYMADRNLADAESEFRKAVEAKPDYADPYFHLAMILESRGDASGAKANYQKFIELAKGVDGDFLVKVQKRMAELK